MHLEILIKTYAYLKTLFVKYQIKYLHSSIVYQMQSGMFGGGSAQARVMQQPQPPPQPPVPPLSSSQPNLRAQVPPFLSPQVYISTQMPLLSVCVYSS